jgi:hypothetical protein
MVDLLSTNLDGAGGLRAIDSRTTLARWREGTSQGGDPDLETALGIAGRTGASYAVFGSAVETAEELRLSAQVYRIRDGANLDAVQVAGPSDSLTSLVDRLSIGILRGILTEKGRDLPAGPHLAAVTTTSLSALRSYLEGEVLYRRGAFVEAVEAYERAVQSDCLRFRRGPAEQGAVFVAPRVGAERPDAGSRSHAGPRRQLLVVRTKSIQSDRDPVGVREQVSR